MGKKSDGVSNGMALLCTVGIMLLIGLIIEAGQPKCIASGCNNDAKEGSRYCWLHDNSYSGWKSNSSSSTRSSSTGRSSSSSSSNRSNDSSNRSSSKKKSSSVDAYDEGYNAIYEDEDYDWDRYQRDDDYASGVDDAMEDMDW